jgi:2-polyprenyl-3-methyl-5-hydroxy-6-metoxy-1,4-benzoquinol methylase
MYTLRPWQGSQSFAPVVAFELPQVMAGARLTVDLQASVVGFAGQAVSGVSFTEWQTHRKFVVTLEALNRQAKRVTRTFLHYLAWGAEEVNIGYYHGDDYVDYNQSAPSLARSAVRRIERYVKQGRLLDVGCAYGFVVREALAAGFDAYGVDFSADAVAQAEKLVGPGRFSVGNVEESVPFVGEFDLFSLNSVIEHFRDPEAVIRNLSARAANDAWIFIKTMNSDSLSHSLFGTDWEGYSDYTHHSIDLMTPSNLRQWVEENGWKIVDLYSRAGPFVVNVDPLHSHWRTIGLIPGMGDMIDHYLKGDFIYLIAHRSVH